jgi:membrane protease subunit HflC
MKNSFTILIGVLLVGVLLSKMFMYQVRYDQVAVVSTFDKADDSSIEREPGLKFRLPWPVQDVTLYSKRLELLEDKMEEVQTADGKSVIVKTYLAWRITNPLEFYVTLKDPSEAAGQLKSRLREIRGVISRYSFDQLVNLDRDKVKLAEIEDIARKDLQDSLSKSGYGIDVERVGVYKIVLPSGVTEAVFDTMIKTRERLADSARQEGQAQASAIRSEAESARDRIRTFANRRAQAIRSLGDQDAAKDYQQFARNEEFAIFLRKIDALKKILPHNTTYVFSANSLSLLRALRDEPGEDAPAGKPSVANAPGGKP